MRFVAQPPLSIGVIGVDWEEQAGVGLETGRGAGGFQTGDAGLILEVKDSTGAVVAATSADWRCQPTYISPLDADQIDCAADQDSGECGDNATCFADGNFDDCYAVHFEESENWTSSAFDDTSWQAATTYTAAQVTNQTAYQGYTSYFANADFIWSSNLNLDNRVLCRGQSVR